MTDFTEADLTEAKYDPTTLMRAWLWWCDDASFWSAIPAIQAEAARRGLDDWEDAIMLAGVVPDAAQVQNLLDGAP